MMRRSQAVSIAFFVAVVALTYWLVLRATDGNFTYVLDDTYIHMTLARTLAQSGTWGLEPGHFVTASSSPLWTIILAFCFKIVGVHEIIPLALNVGFGIGFVLALCSIIANRTLICFVLLLGSIPAMTFLGMEHTAHALVILLLAWEVTGAQRPRRLFLLAAVAAGLRYETAFIITGASAVLLYRRAWLPLFAICSGALVTVAVFALFFVAHGSGPLPNSVIAKMAFTGWTVAGSGRALITHLFLEPTFLAYLLYALAAILLSSTRDARLRTACAIYAIGLVLHAAFSTFGWMFRYESYLAAGLAVFPTVLIYNAFTKNTAERWRRLAAAALLVAVFVPVGLHAYRFQRRVPDAASDIYRQHVQNARFIRTYYPGANVAVNDLGVASFAADAHVLDLLGLGDSEVLRLRRERQFTTARIDELTQRRHVRIAIVYDEWFTGASALPATWQKAGEWELQNPYIASRVVSIYAVPPESVMELRARLQAFSKTMPAGTVSRITP